MPDTSIVNNYWLFKGKTEQIHCFYGKHTGAIKNPDCRKTKGRFI